MSGYRNNYSPKEVRRIVETYAELRARVDTNAAGLRVLVLLIDLERGVRALPLAMREYVVLHGLLGLDQVTTGLLLQVSQRSVSRRYQEALEQLHYEMNGGFYF